jgi:DNA-binding NarL/FixJ family response regulator
VTAEASALSPSAADEGALTRRDREVLKLVAMGFSNKEIAERLFLAEGTVKNRVSQILEKIGARDRTPSALRAPAWGLL